MDDSIREQTKEIRRRFWRGEITEAEGIALLKPFLDAYNRIAKAKAKELGMRAPSLIPAKYLRTRFDLRWEAQERQHAQRDQQDDAR